MKIAIPTIGGILDEYFELCEVFTVFTLDEYNNIIGKEILYTPEGCDCKNNPGLTLKNMGVTVLLANIMPVHANGVCAQYGITPYLGYTGQVTDVVESFVKKLPKPKVKKLMDQFIN